MRRTPTFMSLGEPICASSCSPKELSLYRRCVAPTLARKLHLEKGQTYRKLIKTLAELLLVAYRTSRESHDEKYTLVP